MGEVEHFVQFYEDDAFLFDSVGEFIGSGLGGGHGALVLATAAHIEVLEERLQKQGIDVAAVKASGQLVLIEAATALAEFMVNDLPDPKRFRTVIGEKVEKLSANRRSLRAFGEMVALLWEEGNREGALQLEQLWNEMATSHSFALFCAYPMRCFQKEAQSESFFHICQQHTRVIPSESYAAKSNDDERLRAIALLQQKAAALENEIAERKRVEEKLRRTNQELTAFFENATIGLHWVREDGTIKWANKAEYELLGYTKEEYLGRSIRDVHVDEPAIGDILNRLSCGETLKDYEARLRCKDGSVKHVLINSNVLWDGDRFIHTQCFTRDITEQKKAEQELREAKDKLTLANEELERRVAERTARLEETVAELEAFSYSLSHDMRSPLRAMHAHASALIEDCHAKLSDSEIGSLERIRRASSRLDALIRDVLAYSKVSQGQIHLQPIDLSTLVDDVILEQFHDSRAHISIERPLLSVSGHESYVTQCITNLLGNALKFVARGAVPQVQVRTKLIGNEVRVEVQDHGIGIRPEHRERIFQLFGRVYSEKDYEGTGIGLCIVRKAILRMGGEIGFTSEPGKGTLFWFSLPAA
jgi:PAS domain S-box-containing protein